MSFLRRTLALAALSAVVFGSGVAVAGQASAATPARPQVGVQFKGMWSDYTDTQRAAVLDKLAAAGVDTVRIDVSWAMLQPTGPDSYDTWGVGFVDRVITMARERGLTPLVTLWMTPAWANGGRGDRALPTNPADYARAARWAAAKWAGRVGAWEIWNEPNSDDFMTGADPVAYARLLQAAYPAIKAGDPQATVVSGGTMYVDTDWIAKMYAAGAGGNFDAIAVHPYMGVADQAPETPDDGTQWTLAHVASLHDLMVQHGDGAKGIWLTEMGWSTHATAADAPNWQRGVTEKAQADFTVRSIAFTASKLPWVTHMFFYTERDQVDSHVQDNNYGLLRRDLTPKPVYAALQAHLSGSATTTTPLAPVAPVTPVAPPVPATTTATVTTPAPVENPTVTKVAERRTLRVSSKPRRQAARLGATTLARVSRTGLATEVSAPVLRRYPVSFIGPIAFGASRG